MKIKISQIQDKNLLLEHAKSSYSLTFWGRNEFYISIFVIILGLLNLYFFKKFSIIGYYLIAVGIYESIKYLNRYQRFARLRSKEPIFGKEIRFTIEDNKLLVHIEEEKVEFSYKDMRDCLISKTGILFKIRLKLYYYISFNSFKEQDEIDLVKEHLLKIFPPK